VLKGALTPRSPGPLSLWGGQHTECLALLVVHGAQPAGSPWRGRGRLSTARPPRVPPGSWQALTVALFPLVSGSSRRPGVRDGGVLRQVQELVRVASWCSAPRQRALCMQERGLGAPPPSHPQLQPQHPCLAAPVLRSQPRPWEAAKPPQPQCSVLAWTWATAPSRLGFHLARRRLGVLGDPCWSAWRMGSGPKASLVMFC